jgi:hypothetical protein
MRIEAQILLITKSLELYIVINMALTLRVLAPRIYHRDTTGILGITRR